MINTEARLSEVDGILERHRAFWKREPVDEPLIGSPLRDSVFPLANLKRGLKEGSIVPDDIHPEEYIPVVRDEGPLQRDGDLVRAEWAVPSLPWTEAIAGCPVHVLWESGTTWAGLSLAPSAPLASYHPGIRRDWLNKLGACTQALVEQPGRRYWVSTTLMRGPLDMLAAMIGSQRLCVAFVDEPKEVERLLDFCTSAWIEAAQVQLAVIPAERGGYTNRYAVWAPGTSVVYQADLSSVISPGTYEEFLLPCSVRITQSFDYITVHSHSAGQTQLDLRLNLDGLDCIEIAIDPTGPSVEDLLPMLSMVLARKPLVMMGSNEEQTRLLVESLPSEGLCIIPRC